jgi:rare lipoprotein A
MLENTRRIGVIVAAAALAAACASTPPPGGGGVRLPPNAGVYKVGNPYQIDGTWYYPHEQPDYDETGIASWYGPTFYGHHTANGEIYDGTEFTAAHRTLPMPVNVRVTNLDNGKSIIVRVNDRGPYAKGRIIDLSEAAAPEPRACALLMWAAPIWRMARRRHRKHRRKSSRRFPRRQQRKSIRPR